MNEKQFIEIGEVLIINRNQIIAIEQSSTETEKGKQVSVTFMMNGCSDFTRNLPVGKELSDFLTVDDLNALK